MKAFLFIMLFAFDVNQPFAAQYRCDVPNVLIVADDPKSASLTCDGAKRAMVFTEEQGLDVPSEIFVELVPQIDNKDVAGHLLMPSKKALVLNYSAFIDFGNWLKVPVNTEIYRALVTHEVAHVIVAHNIQIPRPTVQAHEYIAYVTTFATMDRGQRDLILKQFPGDGFETEQQMNTTIYLCDPMRFGAEAYRHFIKQGNGANFFRLILIGQVLAE